MSPTSVMSRCPSPVEVGKSRTRCSPKPSMSIAPREAKCSMRAGHPGRAQSRLGQTVSALALGAHERTAAHRALGREPPLGAGPSCARPSTGPTTSGITSPALRTMTVSPGRTSLASTWSSLCRVARPTVEPPTNTGSSTANGVARPVRPIDTMMSREQGGALLGRELVGDRPAGRLGGRAELVPQGQVVDLHDHAVDLVGQVVAVLLPVQAVARRPRRGCDSRSISGFTGKPSVAQPLEGLVVGGEGRARPRPRRAGSSRTPGCAVAVMAASFWRSDPAAVLRGLT